jgi:hypothetical protein
MHHRLRGRISVSYSIYQASVPVFLQQLGALSAILDKAAAHASESGIAQSELISARLAADMLPLSSQVQIATDHAKGATARLSGRDVPKYEDNEASFDELKARIAKTIEFVKSVPAGEIEGAESRDIKLTIGGQERILSGERYLARVVLPNFFFHVTTAYDILRNKGVPLGKRDFLGV